MDHNIYLYSEFTNPVPTMSGNHHDPKLRPTISEFSTTPLWKHHNSHCKCLRVYCHNISRTSQQIRCPLQTSTLWSHLASCWNNSFIKLLKCYNIVVFYNKIEKNVFSVTICCAFRLNVNVPVKSLWHVRLFFFNGSCV